MIEDAGNAPKQVDIYIFFLEYFIDIGTGAAELGGEPCHGASLCVKRAFDKLSRMNHASAADVCPPGFPKGERITYKLAGLYKKGVGISPSLVPRFKAFAMPYYWEQATQKAHADMYNTRNLPLF